MSALRQKFLAFRVYRLRDSQAYGALYDIHADRIRRYLTFKVPRPEDADELTSEVFLRGWEYMTTSVVENTGALYFRIARNLVADFYRKHPATEPLTEAMAATLAAPGSFTERLADQEETDSLLTIIKGLKDEYRDVLLMKYVSEMNVAEIASALEKTPNAIRVLLHRAKQALKKRVI